MLIAGVGFSTKVWEENLKGKKVPEGFGHYITRKGELGEMPRTEGSLILHVKGDSYSLCYEAIQEFINLLPKDSIELIEDYYGFQYQDGRDLSGFLDGTENTSGDEERSSAGINSNGGSYLIHQRWEHNIPLLNKENIQTQESWVGRKKHNSEEIPKEKMPKNSHVSRMRDEKYQRIPIVRQSMPYGNFNKNGLLFIAYSSDVSKFNKMLDRMTGKSTDGLSDSIMKYSKCVTGNYWYFPSLTELKNLEKNY